MERALVGTTARTRHGNCGWGVSRGSARFRTGLERRPRQDPSRPERSSQSVLSSAGLADVILKPVDLHVADDSGMLLKFSGESLESDTATDLDQWLAQFGERWAIDLLFHLLAASLGATRYSLISMLGFMAVRTPSPKQFSRQTAWDCSCRWTHRSRSAATPRRSWADR